MPRKRSAVGVVDGTTSVSSSASTDFVAPGGGSRTDLEHLASTLGLSVDACLAIMNCEGQGISPAGGRRSTTGGVSSGLPAIDPAMASVWGDFMSEEMPTTASSSAPVAAPTLTSASSKSSVPSSAAVAASSSSASSANEPREYILPVPPRMRLVTTAAGKKDKEDDDRQYYQVPIPGVLCQTGTLDASVPGRGALTKDSKKYELQCPTILFPTLLKNFKIAFIATSPTSCHSIAITTTGVAYGWGRNETGQLGLGYVSSVVPTPTQLSVVTTTGGGGEGGGIKFVGAGVGKYHTILIGSDGMAYASGGNLCGQLGINNQGCRGCDKFKKCIVSGQGDGEEEGDVKIVQASCGENISALLSSSGHLYTAGSSEWGQVGNGETGEYIIAAGRLGFSNCYKFVRRNAFVQSETDRDGAMGARQMMTSGAVDSTGKVKCVSIDDALRIRLSSVSCGRNHLVAVEAPAPGHVPRVFTWGCGDYGCLGHGVQADEYTPRMVGAFRGPVFANNHPVYAVAGGNCSLILTKHGHVYYVGRHKSTGEATMRPSLVDALANNGHVVTCVGAGSQTVFCSTNGGVTVSWGNGSHGELGYGKDEKKSSAKPEFVSGLDSCLVTGLSCGMGHTLFIVRNDDEEDAKSLKKVGVVEESDVADFIEQIKEREVEADGEPVKKKGKR